MNYLGHGSTLERLVGFIVICLVTMFTYPPCDVTKTYHEQKTNRRNPGIYSEKIKYSSAHDNNTNITSNKKLSEEEIQSFMESSSPNLPYKFWYRTNEKFRKADTSCGEFPDVVAIQWRDKYWQTFNGPNDPPVYLFAAYVDDRQENATFVRVIALSEQMHDIVPKLNCQFWYDNKSTAVTADHIESTNLINGKHSSWARVVMPGAIKPEVLTFKLPDTEIPGAVSIVASPCDKATNLVKVIPPPPSEHKKTNIGVCVHGASYYNDDSIERVEWFEALKLMGVDKVHLYIYNVNPKVLKVFQYYQEQGFVDMTEISIPNNNAPNIPELQTKFLYQPWYEGSRWSHDKLEYNDCLYKNMYHHKYIAIIDLDEMIVPKNHTTWLQMLKSLNGSETGWIFQMADFPHIKDKFPSNKKVPKYITMLQQLHKSDYYSTKEIVKTDRASYVHNHYATECLPNDGSCQAKHVPTEVGIIHHYKKSRSRKCMKNPKECVKFVRDDRMLFYQDPLMKNTYKTLRKLGLI